MNEHTQLDWGSTREHARPAVPTPARRQAILDVATRLWGTHGYGDLTLRRVAEQAGVALALIDHHFGGKARLLAEVVAPLKLAFAQQAPEVFEPAGARGLGHDGTWRLVVTSALAAPIETLAARGRPGLGLLQFWQRQCNDPTPEVSAVLRQAFAPVEARAAEAALAGLPSERAAAMREALGWLCRLTFGNGVAVVLRELESHTDGEAPAAPSAEQVADATGAAREHMASAFAPMFQRLRDGG
ncbi:MAG TPA: helix-turn-helix domain-containing protein [Methylibium sp.]|uniref:helix-turn-helix domain-containing protein n=1 Tax=Methylibium sp. TaxID=2067992 RepID=UPI002DBB8A0C|nr:helix-turn-helix domain-containing protein [Methylibium sp.]HEU4458533.1 helix-turn-helix domain-containing protein [Methylibium sp.]